MIVELSHADKQSPRIFLSEYGEDVELRQSFFCLPSERSLNRIALDRKGIERNRTAAHTTGLAANQSPR